MNNSIVDQHRFFVDSTTEWCRGVHAHSGERFDEQKGDYGIDWSHIKSKSRFFYAKDYIIYINDEDHLAWQTSAQFDSNTRIPHSKYDHSRCNNIINQSIVLRASMSDELPRHVRTMAFSYIAAALANCFEFDYDNGDKMAALARQYIDDRNQEVARFWYLSAALVAIALPTLVGAFFLFSGMISKLDDLKTASVAAVTAVAVGSIGAFLSILSRSGTYRFDLAAGRIAHYLDAFLRVLSGILSGSVVYFAISNGLLSFPIAKENGPLVLPIFGALAGGFGERLIGSIISLFEPAGKLRTP